MAYSFGSDWLKEKAELENEDMEVVTIAPVVSWGVSAYERECSQ